MTIRFPSELVGERVLLRLPRLADAAPLHHAVTKHVEVARYLTWRPHESVEATSSVLADIQRWNERDDEQTWLIVQDDAPIGMLSCWAEDGAIELGFCLGPEHWGQGYMQDVLTLIIGHLREQPDVKRIWATTDIDNSRSAKTMQAVGLTQTGVIEAHVVHPNIDAAPRDSLGFELPAPSLAR